MSQIMKEIEEASSSVAKLLSSDKDIYQKLGERLRALQPKVVATIARGSSDHAASYAGYLISVCTGVPVASLPLSLASVFDAPLNLQGQFALALSQSGESPDLLKCFNKVKTSGALSAAIVNGINSPLAQTAEFVLPQHAGIEKSIAATKSVICTLAAVARLCAEWTQDTSLARALNQLPTMMATAIKTGKQIDDGLLKNTSHVYVLSRGLGLGSAQEIALKLKEICGLHAEAFSAAEVRHGPREIVDQSFLVIALALPGSGGEDVVAAAYELKSQGARVLIVGPKSVGASSSESVILPDGVDSRLMPIVVLQSLYPWLVRSALALGRNPDQPRILKSKVVKTV